MFVSIAMDAGSEERARELADLLAQYGFQRIQRGLWESAMVSPGTLDRLKRDLDRATDGFDKLRFFQFPIEGALVLSSLQDKKWRRTAVRDAESAGGQYESPVDPGYTQPARRASPPVTPAQRPHRPDVPRRPERRK